MVSGRTDHGPIHVKPNVEVADGGWFGLEIDMARFESSEPSQPPGSLDEVPRHSENRRHFSKLATKSPVSSKDFVRNAQNSEACLCPMNFQYPKFRNGEP